MKRFISLLLAFITVVTPAYSAGPLIWGANNAAQNLAPGGVYLPNQQPILYGEQTGNGTNYIAIEAPDAVTTNTTFKLPNGDGGANQVLATNGSGQLQWADPAGLSTVNPSGGTSGVTLTTSSTDVSVFTPSSNITVKLDNSFAQGRRMTIVNNGTAEISLTANNNDVIRTIYRTTTATVVSLAASPADDADWAGYEQVVSPWIAYTPTTQGVGTLSSVFYEYKRIGSSIIIRARFTTGTVTGSEAQFGLPSGLTVGSAPSSSATLPVGYFETVSSLTNQQAQQALITSGDSFINCGRLSADPAGGTLWVTNPFTPVNGDSCFNSSSGYSITTVPFAITEWGEYTE